jgi:glycosyltransferase involved in cell wall biosynthesis
MSPSPIQGHDALLATFAISAYNQHGYIRDAVQAALAQTQRQLDIILSVDSSSDRTSKTCRQKRYFLLGPMSSWFNRNEVNASIGIDLSRANGLATGDLMVAAKRDDIAIANRGTAIEASDPYLRAAIC